MRYLKKFLHDFVLIFYDDTNFEAMSLPRVVFGLAFLMFAIVTFVELYMRCHYPKWDFGFPHYVELTGFCTACITPYCVKKFKNLPTIPPKGDDDNVAEDKGNDTNG